jgi:hypothetical protein
VSCWLVELIMCVIGLVCCACEAVVNQLDVDQGMNEVDI